MSKITELYLESKDKITLFPESYETLIEEITLTEKDQCRLFGVACSFGICDECELTRKE